MRSRFLATLLAVVGSTIWCGPTLAGLVSFQAVYVIDGKTTFNPGDTVIINGPDFGNVEIGDRFVVDFSVDTSQVDTNDTITNQDNALLAGDTRHGNFGSVLSSLSITAAPGNTGTFDPFGLGINSDTASETTDGVAVYKADNAIANSENIRVLAAIEPTPGVLGGSLTDVVQNFRNIGNLGIANPDDYLDDRSNTVDPFDFDSLFLGPLQLLGDARDLILLTDDILGTGFLVDNLNRPLSLRFGEAVVLPQTGPSFQQSIYAWGTFESLSLAQVPVPGTLPLILGALGGLFASRRRRA